MSCLIEIESKDEELGAELLRKVKDLPANIILKTVAHAQAVNGNFTFFLSLGVKVDTALVANWLFENIKDRAIKLRMDKVEVHISRDEIEKVIGEKIKNRGNVVFTPFQPIQQKIKMFRQSSHSTASTSIGKNNPPIEDYRKN